jgi:hypothetical protein
MYIDGTATTILAAQPGLVQFSAADVAEKRTRELKVFNSLDVDWSTLRVHIEPASAKLVDTDVRADHVRVLLRPCPPPGVIDFTARVQLDVDLAAPNAGVKHCAVAVAVQGSQHVDVQVAPRIVFGSWSPDTNKGTARFMVRGLTSATSAAISSISCDGFRAAWITKDVSPRKMAPYRTLQIELNLSEPEAPLFDLSVARRVEVVLSTGESLEVPVYLVAQQERS